MNELMHIADDYLQIRRRLGFKLEREGRLLPDFISFLQQQDAMHITGELALQWATTPSNAKARWWASRLAVVRLFARFAHAVDSRHQIPAKELLPSYKRSKLVPHVYSDDEVKCLMHRAECLLHGLKAKTYATLFGLLYTTGMRVGEAINLNDADIHWQQGVLTLHHTKFGKSRQLPLHVTTLRALRQYAEIRDASVCARSSGFLLSLAGTRLNYKNVHETFIRLVRTTDLDHARPQRPRIHDFRHSFAITTLTRWYQQGLDVDALLPVLSTYLGHVSPATTYWYLSATPELMAQAADRLDLFLGDLP